MNTKSSPTVAIATGNATHEPNPYTFKNIFHTRGRFVAIILVLMCLLLVEKGWGQVTIFSENMGSPSGTTAIASNIFQNSTSILTYSGSGDVRTSTASTGYTGATGSGNVFLTNTIGTNFQIANIVTTGFATLSLSFGAFKSTTASNMSELILEYSTNGSSYTSISIPAQPTGTGTATWRLISGLTLPVGAEGISNLRLRWRNTSATPQFRIDDVVLTGIASSCTPPTVSATGLNTTVLSNSMNVSWTNPSSGADGVIVLCKSVSGVNSNPVSGVGYSASSVLGLGSQIGSGNFVVYTGTGNNVSVTGLNSSTAYYFSVYTYSSTGVCYNTLNVLTGTGTTSAAACSTPTEATIVTASSGNDIVSTISWTNPTCFDDLIIVAKANSAISSNPIGDGSAYSGSLSFGSGSAFGGGFVVYKGNISSQTVTNLVNGTEYFFKIFVRKGLNWSAGVEVFATPNNGVSYYSRGSGLHNGSIWSTSRSGTASSATFSSNNSFVIQNGHIVEMASSGVDILNLSIENGGRIYRNDATTGGMRYINLFGNINCNGTVGSSTATFDAIGINVEGVNCSVTGNGNFNPARIRKSATTNVNSTFTFGSNATLPFPGTSLYNNVNGGNLFFVINPNIVVIAKGDGTTPSDVSLDGVSGTAGERSGGYTISGILSVTGTSFFVTDNNASQIINFQINNNGKLFTNNLDLNTSGTSGHLLTIKNGGQLTVNNSITNFSTTNNTFNFEQGSTFEYAGSGQAIQPLLPYSNLLISGSGDKTLSSNLIVSNNLSITGTAVLPATTRTITVAGNWLQSNTSNFSSSAATIVLNGGAATIDSKGESFENLIISSSGSKTLVSNLNCTQNVSIIGGTLDVGTNTFDGGANLFMTGGTLRLAKTGVGFLPELSGTTYSNSGGVINLYGSGSQTLRGARDYATVSISGTSYTKLSSNPNSILGIAIADQAVFDVENNDIGSNSTTLTMTGTAIYRTSRSGVVPTMGNLYFLGSSTGMEFYGTNSSVSIRQGPTAGGSAPHPYQNISFTGITTITGPTSIFNIKGNLTNNLTTGRYINNNNTISFTGTNQTISGSAVTDFYNLNVGNNTTVTLASPQRIINTLTVGNAAALNANSNLTLVSSFTNTARVASIPSGSTILGSVNVQRYIPAKRAIRFLSSPVAGATLADWKNNMSISGLTGTAGGFDATGFPTVTYYNEPAPGDVNFGWSRTNNINNVLETGRGYQAIVRGDRTTTNTSSFTDVPTTATTLAVNGPLNQGSIAMPLTYTNNGIATADGWNLVGNPYASPIDWNAASGWTKTNVADAIYFYDPNTDYTSPTTGLGSYVSCVDGTCTPSYPTSVNGLVIPSGQGFFVQATATGASLTVNEAAKTTLLGANFSNRFRTEFTGDYFELILTTPTGLKDYCMVRFKEGATDQFDSDKDAIKFRNSSLNLYTRYNGHDFAINSIPHLGLDSLVIPVGIEMDTLNTHTIGFKLQDFSFANTFKLLDTKLDSTIAIEDAAKYEFKGNTADRFYLILKKEIVEDTVATGTDQGSFEAIDIDVVPNPIAGNTLGIVCNNCHGNETIEVSLTDVMGKTMLTAKVQTTKNQKIELPLPTTTPEGMYLLRLNKGSNQYLKKVLYHK